PSDRFRRTRELPAAQAVADHNGCGRLEAIVTGLEAASRRWRRAKRLEISARHVFAVGGIGLAAQSYGQQPRALVRKDDGTRVAVLVKVLERRIREDSGRGAGPGIGEQAVRPRRPGHLVL